MYIVNVGGKCMCNRRAATVRTGYVGNQARTRQTNSVIKNGERKMQCGNQTKNEQKVVVKVAQNRVGQYA